MPSTPLTKEERFLLEWLAEEDFSQYGECHGKALDGLIEKGLAQVHGPGEHQSGFIARGAGKMYSAVSLTEAGRSVRMDEKPVVDSAAPAQAPMPEETRVALLGSIAKWEKIVAGTGKDLGPENCPLCKLFRDTRAGRVVCEGCPVAERTGRPGCERSPYDHFEALEQSGAEGEELREAAEAELEFLRGLLPQGEAKP